MLGLRQTASLAARQPAIGIGQTVFRHSILSYQEFLVNADINMIPRQRFAIFHGAFGVVIGINSGLRECTEPAAIVEILTPSIELRTI